MQIPIHYDMETSDPDDALTLCLLSTHPSVSLKSVSITPGSRHQVGVVKKLLEMAGREDVQVGSRKPDHEKECVSAFHYRFLGNVPPSDPDDLGHTIIAATLKKFPETTLLTGASLQNLRYLLQEHPEIQIHHWVAQGGFAGDSVVPEEHRLEKFKGMEICPTFNFNGDPKGALLMLSSERVMLRHLVSKNVCHGVVYDQEMHHRIQALSVRHRGLDLMHQGMEVYLEKNAEGKKFHDPLAACVAICQDVCEFREVEAYREKGMWGCRLKEKTNTFISVALRQEKFLEVLLKT